MADRAAVDGSGVVIRVMRPEEFGTMRGLSVSAFGGDPQIGVLLDNLHESWAWDDALSFVAELDGGLVGQVLYTHAFLDAPNRLVDVLVLSPIGVRPDQQGRGIGSLLIRETLTRLGPSAESMVFLEGSPRYYPRFGFQRALDLDFTPPSVRIPPDAFMVYRLPKYETWMIGALVYPDAFWRADAVGLRDSTVG
jgi:putative acetyltransferase